MFTLTVILFATRRTLFAVNRTLFVTETVLFALKESLFTPFLPHLKTVQTLKRPLKYRLESNTILLLNPIYPPFKVRLAYSAALVKCKDGNKEDTANKNALRFELENALDVLTFIISRALMHDGTLALI